MVQATLDCSRDGPSKKLIAKHWPQPPHPKVKISPTASTNPTAGLVGYPAVLSSDEDTAKELWTLEEFCYYFFACVFFSSVCGGGGVRCTPLSLFYSYSFSPQLYLWVSWYFHVNQDFLYSFWIASINFIFSFLLYYTQSHLPLSSSPTSTIFLFICLFCPLSLLNFHIGWKKSLY